MRYLLLTIVVAACSDRPAASPPMADTTVTADTGHHDDQDREHGDRGKGHDKEKHPEKGKP